MSERETTRLTLDEHRRRREGQLEIHEFSMRVPTRLRWLRGHFPDSPVLPAMVQLQEALRQATSIWPELVRLRRITNAKFRRPIRPQAALLLRLERKGPADRVRFTYADGGETCSSGFLEFLTPLESRSG